MAVSSSRLPATAMRAGVATRAGAGSARVSGAGTGPPAAARAAASPASDRDGLTAG